MRGGGGGGRGGEEGRVRGGEGWGGERGEQERGVSRRESREGVEVERGGHRPKERRKS